MDHFGIGAAVQGALEVYLRSARGTGRTTSLVDSVKTGDRVVFVDQSQAKRFVALCMERGVQVDAVTCDPSDVERLFVLGSVRGDGRMIFDHVWVEEYYRLAIARARADIDRLQREIGGHGAPHRETARAVREQARWMR